MGKVGEIAGSWVCDMREGFVEQEAEDLLRASGRVRREGAAEGVVCASRGCTIGFAP